MAVDIGPKIGIEGEREFRQQIQQTNQALKTLAAEEKAVTSAFQGEADAEKKASAQKEVLNKQISAQKDKLALLEKGLRDSTQKFGEADERTLKWQEAVHNATAKLNNMEGQLRDVDKEVDETGDSMEEAGEKTKGWADVMKGQLLADAIKGGLSKLADMAKSAASAMWDASKAGAAYGDEILTLQSTTGLNTDTLQEYKYMADLVDVSLDTVAGSLSKLTRSMSSAKGGTGEAAEAFKELGVAITDENGNLRKNEDVFNDLLTALGKIDNETERDAKAMTIFGKSAKELNPLIEAGADRLNELRKEAHDTGYVLSGSALNALSKQQDAMDRLGKKTEALKNRFVSGLAPGIAKAADKMAETFDNPYVKRGMDNLSATLGNIVDEAANLVSDILPGIIQFFSSDPKIRLMSEAELELINRTEDAAKAQQELIDTYNSNAGANIAERERVEALWKELQKLVTEDGYVKAGNEERADFILTELNEALGTEYTMNGNLIEQYGQMKTSLEDLIKMRSAEAQLETFRERYDQATANKDQFVEDAGAYIQLIEDAQAEVDRLAGKVAELDEAWRKANPGGVQVTAYGNRYSRDATTVTDREYRDALEKLRILTDEYSDAEKAAAKAYSDIERYEKSRAAYLAGNYELALYYLENETGATLQYYNNKKELNQKDREELQALIDRKKEALKQYQKFLEEGYEGVSEEGLQEIEEFIANAQKILDGQKVAGLFIDGLINGLNARRQDVYNASRNVALSVTKAVKQTLDIQSPSRVGDWIGQMWDEGLIRGMERKEEELAATASSLADTITDATTPDATVSGYGNSLTASGAGSYASSSYTTNMGGIAVYVNGAGAVNEDELAKRIAVQLTDELTRAQRGGRR